uniref:Uncharacterized protein n=1 Tax=Candidatus Kentrum sp. TC TaxID=2126339 RepID=A0A450YVX4_9GAMM|nr:MAG: hypothetical protein BECKTC1821E_GA0114239_10533 [Candidatus Kentron sp. TC]VFK47498.1 MAG: hypothetical protein BECKTC1821D_GA0114238_10483 [Candidatus Kentron sp. TC]VFK60921.1 MAG: hypothetical protein BECKTC1821F_GA0114240_105111 [Candidatus Kentron sp. TC]
MQNHALLVRGVASLGMRAWNTDHFHWREKRTPAKDLPFPPIQHGQKRRLGDLHLTEPLHASLAGLLFFQ